MLYCVVLLFGSEVSVYSALFLLGALFLPLLLNC